MIRTACSGNVSVVVSTWDRLEAEDKKTETLQDYFNGSQK